MPTLQLKQVKALNKHSIKLLFSITHIMYTKIENFIGKKKT